MKGATQESETIGALFSQLIDDANQVLRAEVNVYKASAFERVAMARAGLIKLAVGAALLFCALLPLLLGCLLALAQLIGPLLAGLALAAGSTIIGLVFLASGKKNVALTLEGKLGTPLTEVEEKLP